MTISGTAADVGGQVAAVEVSTDGGTTWQVAAGTANWTYTWLATGVGKHSILSRAIDDSLNTLTAAAITPTVLTVNAPPPPTSFHLFAPTDGLTASAANDGVSYELGVKFQASAAGFITQLEYLRGAADASDTDVRSGHLWGPDGTLLATATFTSTPGQTGWQTAALSTPVAIQPGTTYLASYHTDNNYVFTGSYFSSSAHSGPDGFLIAPASSSVGGNGVFSVGTSPALPNQTFNASNYWVDVTFKPLTVTGPNAPPQITSGTAFTAPENQTAVTTVTATDPDLPAQTLSYSILLPTGTNGAGADGALFQIDPATGALSFKTAPDFEAPRDAGADNVYNLTVAVSDGAGGVAQQNLAVTVGNVAEPPGTPANFTGRTVQASYIFGAAPDALFTGAGAVQTATVDAAAGGAVEFPLLPSAGPDVGNGQFGLASVDVGSTSVRLEFPLDPAIFSGSVNFASAADRPFNGVRLTATDGLLRKSWACPSPARPASPSRSPQATSRLPATASSSTLPATGASWTATPPPRAFSQVSSSSRLTSTMRRLSPRTEGETRRRSPCPERQPW